MTTLQNSDSKTSHLAQLERRRLELQAELDAGKSQAERNRLGQFATPPALAQEILAATKRPMGREQVRFLDPAFGTGAFYYALLSCFPRERIVVAEGYEVDPYYGTPARHLWQQTGLVLHLADFTKAHPPASESERFNLVVCNPPYVRHHHLSGADKERLRKACQQASGISADGLSGLYCYFLVLSHEWLADGGLGVWLLPSEFMDVKYGSWVKRYLTEKVTLFSIHRFDPNEVQFGDALVSSAVVFFRKRLPSAGHEVAFTFGGTLGKPRLEGMIPLAILRREKKWTRFPVRAERTSAGYVLGDFFVIKRGLATGDNSYFILTTERVHELHLPKRFLTPILPGPRHLKGDEILADENGNPLTEPQLFLLDCKLPEDRVPDAHPTLWRYFEEGKARGTTARYLCQHRSPWYAQEQRLPAPFLSTYMGRSDNGTRAPFRFIRNHSKATAANVYLLMYPKSMLFSALQSRPELADRIWAALSRLKPHTLVEEGRVYGGGLHKLEPKELANVPADEIAQLLGLPQRNAGHQLELLG